MSASQDSYVGVERRSTPTPFSKHYLYRVSGSFDLSFSLAYCEQPTANY